MNHRIPLDRAKAMTARYRKEREAVLAPDMQGKNILAICETFDREIIDAILAQEGCVKLRIYYGMDEDLKVHAILVGANAQDEDMLPSSDSSSLSLTDDGEIAEEATRCPTICPPASELNTGP